MKICKKCGQANENENLFCFNCAADISNEEVINDGEEKEQKAKKFLAKKSNIVILAAVLVVAILIVSLLSIFNSPEKKVLMGMYGLINDNSQEGTIIISGSAKTGVSDVDKLVDKSAIEMKYSSNYDKREYILNGSVLIDKKSVFDINLANIDNVVYFELPEAYDDYFYVEEDDEYVEIMEEYLAFADYIKQIDFSALTKGQYRKVLLDELDGITEKEDGKVNVSLSISKVLDIAAELCSVAKDDEKLAGDIYKSLEKLNKQMEKDDFDPSTYEISNFVDGLQELLDEYDEDEFVENILDGLDQLSDQLKYMKNDIKAYGEDIKFVITYDFGMFNKIKSITTTVDLEEVVGEKVKITIENQIGNGPKKKSYSTKKGVDLMEMDDDDAEEAISEISMSVTKRVMKNKYISDLIEESGMLDYYGYDDVDEFLEDMFYDAFRSY